MSCRIPGKSHKIHTANTSVHPGVSRRGFALIELMMAVLLIGVGISLLVPSYKVKADQRLLTNSAKQLLGFISLTRTESIKRNEVITISYSRSGNDQWCVGAVVGATACDCIETSPSELGYCAIDKVWTVLDNTQVGNMGLVAAMSGAGQYAFEPVRGRLVEVADLETNASWLLELQSHNQIYKLDLTVTSTGHISLCSKDADHQVRGFSVCPTQA